MSKNKPPDKGAPEAESVERFKYFEGAGDTTIEGANAWRLTIVELLGLVNKQLSGNAPDLEMISLKKVLEETLKELPFVEQTIDPLMREAKEQEICITIEHAKALLTLQGFLDKRRAMGLLDKRPLINPKESTLVVPPDWDDPGKPLQ